MRRTSVRVVLAALVAAATYVAVPVLPASAAACSTASGVTVVVDFHELGGGVQTACVAGGGGDTAADLFPAAGFPLSYVQRQPGFVCRVEGKPADNPCVNTPPADAYWALFWSDGKSGSWTYSSSGVGGLHVPDGGYVAFSWNGSSARTMPGYSPAPHPSATPTPTAQPTHPTTSHSAQPSPHHSVSPSSSAVTPTASDPASPSASASPTKSPKPHHKKSPSPSATPTEPSASASASTDAVAPLAEPTDPSGGGLPGWVAPVVIVVLFGAAGGFALARRRRGGSA